MTGAVECVQKSVDVTVEPRIGRFLYRSLCRRRRFIRQAQVRDGRLDVAVGEQVFELLVEIDRIRRSGERFPFR